MDVGRGVFVGNCVGVIVTVGELVGAGTVGWTAVAGAQAESSVIATSNNISVFFILFPR